MSTLERVREGLAGIEFRELEARDGMPTLEVAPTEIPAAVRALRDRCGFDMATLVTAVDRYPAEPRFQMVYQFLSTTHRDRVRLHADLPGEDPALPTIVDLFPGTGFMEREVYDMFGIRFEGHPDLRRLLMPEAYEHHPLRKDFPHHGIEPDRLYREWDQRRRQAPTEAS